MRRLRLLVALSSMVVGPSAGAAPAAERLPDILLISIDTLRSDRMSGYGYERNTSPRLDELLSRGARFSEARTPTPLTGPAMVSVMTSLHPHEHGATRNGMRMRPNLVSFTEYLERRGYETAAFVGNWTLKPELSGLHEHFDHYETMLTRKRWFGLVKSEATAEDISARALEWLEGRGPEQENRPFLLWVHYVEPHAPYQLQNEFLPQIGLRASGSFLSAQKRYDSEVAYVDDRVGKLLDRAGETVDLDRTLVVFLSDHGESLGEHGYWGHGRHLYEVTLHVPMGIVWPGRVRSQVIDAPASLLDVGPTLLGLVGLEVPSHFLGFDWSGVMLRGEAGPADRTTWHQAHKASVQPKENLERLRQRGLLEVGRVWARRKELFRPATARHRVFDLTIDPGETDGEFSVGQSQSPELADWLRRVREGLEAADELPPPSLSDEDIEALKALGYID